MNKKEYAEKKYLDHLYTQYQKGVLDSRGIALLKEKDYITERGVKYKEDGVPLEPKRSKVISVVENISDPNFVRRNIITKGAIVETDAGYARITSRPGQVGILNAVLVEYTPPPSRKQLKKMKKMQKAS